MAVNHTSANIF